MYGFDDGDEWQRYPPNPVWLSHDIKEDKVNTLTRAVFDIFPP